MPTCYCSGLAVIAALIVMKQQWSVLLVLVAFVALVMPS